MTAVASVSGVGETNLDKLIAYMQPKLDTSRTYEYCRTKEMKTVLELFNSSPDVIQGYFREVEGHTLILEKGIGQKYTDIESEFQCSCITLEVLYYS